MSLARGSRAAGARDTHQGQHKATQNLGKVQQCQEPQVKKLLFQEGKTFSFTPNMTVPDGKRHPRESGGIRYRVNKDKETPTHETTLSPYAGNIFNYLSP